MLEPPQIRFEKCLIDHCGDRGCSDAPSLIGFSDAICDFRIAHHEIDVFDGDASNDVLVRLDEPAIAFVSLQIAQIRTFSLAQSGGLFPADRYQGIVLNTGRLIAPGNE